MINFSDGAMRWLESILFERFGRYFILAQQSNTLQLSLDDGQGAITFDRLESVFHQARSDFSCKQWQASSEGYFGPVEDVIPAPSEIDLPEPLIELNEKRRDYSLRYPRFNLLDVNASRRGEAYGSR